MSNTHKIMQTKVSLLKEARLQFLKLHKLLVDLERIEFEKLNGKISGGYFLNLLVKDERFTWLRKFSTLIADIDETLSLNDGLSLDMIEKYLAKMLSIVNLQTVDVDFNENYKDSIQANFEVAEKHSKLKKLLIQQ